MKTAVRLKEALVTPVAEILRSMIELSLENQKKAVEVLADKMSKDAFIREFQVLEIKMPRRIGKTTGIIHLCQYLDRVLVIGRGIHPDDFLKDHGAKDSYCLNNPMELKSFYWYEFIIVDNATILNQDERNLIVDKMIESSDVRDSKLLIFVG